MSAEENKASIKRWIEEGWNRGQVDVADELFAPEFSAAAMDASFGNLNGVEDMKAYVRGMRAAFPDIRFTIEHLIAEGDLVVGAFGVEGTHQGTLLGVPPTGKRVSFKAIDIWHFRNGRIVERCVAAADFLRALQQLGVIPQLGQ
jgi:steroid delta-isomerase-like uncharacterized protein